MLGKRSWRNTEEHFGFGRCKRFAEESSQDFALPGVVDTPYCIHRLL